MRSVDFLSAWASRAIDTLFMQNPKGTSFGVLCGVAAKGVFMLFAPALARWTMWIDPGAVGAVYFMAFGAVLFNVGAFRKQRLPDSIEEALELINRTERSGGATRMQARKMRLAVCHRMIERMARDQTRSRRDGATDSLPDSYAQP
jgi:hypothetical protein